MELNLDPIEIESVLAPYLSERMPIDSPEWRARMQRLDRKWIRLARRRRWFGWLPSAPRAPDWLRGQKTQSDVKSEYERIWSGTSFPSPDTPSPRKPLAAQWQDEGLLVKNGGLPRVHLVLMAKYIEELQPKRVLEVGCGDGRNLFSFSARFPQISWSGIELTKAGVERAHATQAHSQLLPEAAGYMPWSVQDDGAYRAVEIRQGNARALPFEDNSFDLCFTHLALEQMEAIRDDAVRELVRVSRGHLLCLEPFADFNQSRIQRNSVFATDYLSLSVDEFASFGVKPLAVTSAFPQKVRLGHGLVFGAV
ncbi:MAG: class I SAM-dependent methyltransferase [Planctomycetota bacterium]